MRKICIITGTRAEWGLLSGLASKLRQASGVQLQIVATNMHLSPKYGHTVDEIRRSGFAVDWEVPMVDEKAPATAVETVRAMGREMSGIATALSRLQPDLVVILGDRYEMLVAASAALIFGIPVAHLYGGEITEGAFDDSIRHAITKMSALHFTATAEYRRRVIQMGEQPAHVFHVGALGCENALKVPRLSREELEDCIGFPLTDKCFLVTYHPVTREGADDGAAQITELLAALDAFRDYRILITAPNSDAGSDGILTALRRYRAAQANRVCLVSSLGMTRYLSALPLMSAVIGNSSSGLVEVPSFHVPTVNIGHRQDGRLRAPSVIDCGNGRAEIIAAIQKALTSDFRAICQSCENPYAKPGTAEAIVDVLTSTDLASLKVKRFYDLKKET